MMRVSCKAGRLFLVALWLLGAGSIQLWACTCESWFREDKIRNMVASEFEKATVVFAGEAETVEIRTTQRPVVTPGFVSFTFFGRMRVVGFRTLRVYKGSPNSNQTVVTGGGGGDCGYDFEVGKQYLVYAFSDPEKSLVTGICTRTQLLEAAEPDLRYINGESAAEEDLLTPKELRRRKTGTFCGRLFRPDGKRLDEGHIYLWKADAPYKEEVWFERPNRDGTFCIESIDPGRYQVSAVDKTRRGPVRYAGVYGSGSEGEAGTQLYAEPGKTVGGLDIHLQPQSVYTVRGRVVTEDGTKVEWEDVEIKATHAPETPLAYLDFVEPHKDGTFEIPRVPHGPIRLETYMSEFVDQRWQHAETRLIVEGDVRDVVIVLKRKVPEKE